MKSDALLSGSEIPTIANVAPLVLTDNAITEMLNRHDLSTALEYEALALLRATKLKVFWATNPNDWGFYMSRYGDKSFNLPYPSSQFAYGVILHELGHYDVVGRANYSATNSQHNDDGIEEIQATLTGMQHTQHWSRTMTISALIPLALDVMQGFVTEATFNAYRDTLVAHEERK